MEAPLRTAVNSVMLKELWSNWEVLWSREAMNVALLWGGLPRLWSRWEAKCHNKFCIYKFFGSCIIRRIFFQVHMHCFKATKNLLMCFFF